MTARLTVTFEAFFLIQTKSKTKPEALLALYTDTY